jgi:hypothetical protein
MGQAGDLQRMARPEQRLLWAGRDTAKFLKTTLLNQTVEVSVLAGVVSAHIKQAFLF